MPTVPKLPAQSRIWSVCPVSRREMKIYLHCPGIPWTLRQILALKVQGRPLNFIKCREVPLTSCKWDGRYRDVSPLRAPSSWEVPLCCTGWWIDSLSNNEGKLSEPLIKKNESFSIHQPVQDKRNFSARRSPERWNVANDEGLSRHNCVFN